MKLIRFFAFLAVVCVATSALAQHAAKGKAKNDDAPAASTQQDAANTAVRQPTKEEVAELTAGLERSLSQPSEGLRQFTTDSGLVGIDLDGTHENVALAKIGPDGKVAVGCVSSKDEAVEFLTAGPKTAAQPATAKPAAKPAAPKPTPALEEK